MEGRINNNNSERIHIKYFQKKNLVVKKRNDTKRNSIETKIEINLRRDGIDSKCQKNTNKKHNMWHWEAVSAGFTCSESLRT